LLYVCTADVYVGANMSSDADSDEDCSYRAPIQPTNVRRQWWCSQCCRWFKQRRRQTSDGCHRL